MRHLIGFLCVLVLGVMPLVGCGETAGDGGNGGTAGSGGIVALCEGNVCPCNEAGIRAAIEAGGNDPYTFDCGGPKTLVTDSEIVISNDVVLNGEGNPTLNADLRHRVFSVPAGVSAELRGFNVTRGASEEGSGIWNEGTLSLVGVTVSENAAEAPGGGIRNEGTLTMSNSTVSGNSSLFAGGGIHNDNSGTMTITNSTVSGNTAIVADGISNQGNLTLTNSTLSGYTANVCCAGGGLLPEGASLTINNTLISGFCDGESAGTVQSGGYNIESPGDSCGLDQTTDLVDVDTEGLNLRPLDDNMGRTKTHALRPPSVAIDVIPEAECGVTEDQRREPRPVGSMCDVGSFERGPIKPGLWLGGLPPNNADGTEFDSGWAICFYVNDAGTALVASTACDIDGGDDEAHFLEVSWKENVGTRPWDESCGDRLALSRYALNTFWVDQIPIVNNTFRIDVGHAEGGGWEIEGTFDGDSATGTALWSFSLGLGDTGCELVGGWTANAPTQ